MPLINKLRSRSVAPSSDLGLLRVVLTVFFAVDGFIFAGWVVRIPDIKEQTGASASSLGLALLCVSAGAVVTMLFTGRLCQRHGSHLITVICAVLLSLSITLPPHAHSVPTLGAVLLLFGVAYGGINVAFNSAAVDLVTVLRRPIMPSFHAAFSLGGMLGAGLGALVAGSLSPAWHLLLLGVVGLVVTAVAGRTLLRLPPARAHAGDHDRAVRPVRAHRNDDKPTGGPRARRLVIVFGLIACCTAYGEGALADWGALHLREDLNASAGAAAVGYSCFALAMTVGRLSGTTLLERLGRSRTVVAGGTLAAAGMLLGALAPAFWAALIGFTVAGLGLANLFPVAVERAGALAGPHGVAVASTLGYGGMLLGPPAIGFMADWLSLPTALTSVAVLAGLAALIGAGAERRTTA
ncbi:MFS transporter [Streptomyces acidiscabies]|uniref:MFS transporter n=1 Tax=Streptomyces acidiscabies TaxID=42234 RepID=UPI00073FA4A2|nr:MFS transporter [Streptomyces acidiscabies]GAQ56411.1 inner membrane protein YbjJ [Streptomyces acidiscabies]